MTDLKKVPSPPRPAPQKAPWIPQKIDNWMQDLAPGWKERITLGIGFAVMLANLMGWQIDKEAVIALYDQWWEVITMGSAVWAASLQYFRNVSERRAAREAANDAKNTMG